MKRVAFILPLLVLLTACATTKPANPVPGPRDAVERVLRASVSALRQEDEAPYCTAFSINADRGYWMTARHCAPKGSGETVGLMKQPALTIYSDPAYDIAVVSSLSRSPALHMAATAPEEGDWVFSSGYGPRGVNEHLAFRRGFVLFPELQWQSDRNQHMVAALLSAPGDSGSPLVNTAGELVGVLWGWNPVNRTTWAAPQTEVARVFALYAGAR